MQASFCLTTRKKDCLQMGQNCSDCGDNYKLKSAQFAKLMSSDLVTKSVQKRTMKKKLLQRKNDSPDLLTFPVSTLFHRAAAQVALQSVANITQNKKGRTSHLLSWAKMDEPGLDAPRRAKADSN